MRAVLVALFGGALALAACGDGTDESIGESTQALETFPNEQAAFDYFLAKGLSAVQSAAIIGNLDQESGLDPAIAQKGGPGRGIAQWSVGGRWDTTKGDNVQAYASQQGKSATSLGLQLDFIWFELTTFPDYGLSKLQATTTIGDAAAAFAKYYEGCGACANATREKYAESVLSRFGNDAPDGSASSSSSSSSGSAPEACTVQASGKGGTCISTSACAALGDHESTTGLCPGSSDIQCCTSVTGADANGTRSDDTADSGGCGASGAAPSGAWLLAVAALIMGSARRRSASCAGR